MNQISIGGSFLANLYPVCGSAALSTIACLFESYATAKFSVWRVVRQGAMVPQCAPKDLFLPAPVGADPFLPAIEDELELLTSGAAMVEALLMQRFDREEHGLQLSHGEYAFLTMATGDCARLQDLLGGWCALRNGITGCIVSGQISRVENLAISARIILDTAKPLPFNLEKCQF